MTDPPLDPAPDASAREAFWPKLWRLAMTGGVPRRSLILAVVVGTALNLINQGDALFGALHIDWLKMALTFAMPYLVSTYGAVSARWDADAS